MNIRQLYAALTAKGVAPAIAKDVADDFGEDPNTGTTDNRNVGNGDWATMNDGTVKNSDDLMQAGPRSANGKDAPRQVSESSDEGKQIGVSEEYQELGASLKSAVGAMVKAEIDARFESLETKVDKIADVVGNMSRKSPTPPTIKSHATPELAKVDIGAVNALIRSLDDRGQISLSERIQAKRLVSHFHIAKASGDMAPFRDEVSKCTSSAIREVFSELAGLPVMKAPGHY